MTVVALLADLQARGVTLEPRGDKLAVRPVSKLSAEELEAIQQNKPEILALLMVPTPPAILPGVMSWRYPWPSAIAGLGQHHVEALDLCADCSCGTWVRYGAVLLCFACAKTRAAGR